MTEKLIAGAVLIALGGFGAWHTSPALIGMLASVALAGLGAWRVVTALRP